MEEQEIEWGIGGRETAEKKKFSHLSSLPSWGKRLLLKEFLYVAVIKPGRVREMVISKNKGRAQRVKYFLV